MIFIGMILFQQRLYSPVNSSDMLWLTLRNIKTDGRLLWEKKIIYYNRSFVGIQKNISWKQEIQKFLTQVSPYFRNRSICADYWGVTVDATKEVLETARRLSDWCIVIVVGDQQYPDKIGENVFLLNKTIRYELAKISAFYKESLLLPNDRYTVLKNLGYLWAIFHEPTIIWDFDIAADMALSENALQVSLNETVEALHVLHHNNTLFNPHLFFISNWKHVWPRGYPFQYTFVSYLKFIRNCFILVF
jgi:hypothetical protein